jgi:uncharacterized membrane-anchored protein
MNQRNRKVLFIACCLMIALSGVLWGQEPAQPQPVEPKIHIDWQAGPTVGKLGDLAEIKIPQGYRFAGKEGAQKVLQITHNIPNGRELGVIVADNANWFMMFEFHDTGFVKDEEGDKLDQDAILKSIQEGTEASNKERSKQGWAPFHVSGWQKTPFYDPQTHNLTWAILGRGDDPKDSGSVNHSVRVLGRHGTMNVDLIAGPDEYASLMPEFNTLMSGFTFVQGNRYSDFVKGDKVAEYGLTALIVGGGAAVALKTGLLAKFWKFIVMGLVALGSALKKLFQKVFGKEEKIDDPNAQAASQGR